MKFLSIVIFLSFLGCSVSDYQTIMQAAISKDPSRVLQSYIYRKRDYYITHPKALIKDIKAGKKVEGASTITQQLVRNIYLNRKKTIQRKLKEMIISMKVEHFLTKEEILERYLNQIYFGHGYYGIATAAF